MPEPQDKLADYQGCANWHTWVVVRCLAVAELVDVVDACTPAELRWLAHHRTAAVRAGVELQLVDWDDVQQKLKG